MTRGRIALIGIGAFALLAALAFPVAAFEAALAGAGAPAALEASRRAGVTCFRALLALHGALALAAAFWPARSAPAALWRAPAERDAAPRAGLALFALLAVATLVRAIGLNGDLWHDEIFTLVDFVRSPALRIVTEYTDDNQHLLYSLLAHASIAAFGESAWALRLPALVFGVASVWATWRLGRLLFDARAALCGAALVAVAYHAVWFSQNARGYTGLLLATTLGTELFLRGCARPRASAWLAYAATIAFGMALHLTMGFVALAHGILWIALTLRVPERRLATVLPPLGALALAGTLTLLCYALVLPQIAAFYQQPAAGVTTAAVVWKSPLWLLAETIRGFGAPLALGSVALGLFALPFAWSGLALLRRAPVAAFAFVLPGALLLAMLIALERNLWPRFFLNAFGFAALLGADGMLRAGGTIAARLHAPPGIARRIPHALAAVLVLLSALAPPLPRLWTLPKQDLSGARDFVQAHAAAGDAIVGLDLTGEDYRAYYAPEFALALTQAELEAHAAAGGSTWVLYSFGGYIEAREPRLWRTVQSFEEVAAFEGTLGGGTIIVRRSPRGWPASRGPSGSP
ncbi:MAG TPA: glycosyltransferase family 39 protein [Myxococcota bacterium]